MGKFQEQVMSISNGLENSKSLFHRPIFLIKLIPFRPRYPYPFSRRITIFFCLTWLMAPPCPAIVGVPHYSAQGGGVPTRERESMNDDEREYREEAARLKLTPRKEQRAVIAWLRDIAADPQVSKAERQLAQQRATALASISTERDSPNINT